MKLKKNVSETLLVLLVITMYKCTPKYLSTLQMYAKLITFKRKTAPLNLNECLNNELQDLLSLLFATKKIDVGSFLPLS